MKKLNKTEVLPALGFLIMAAGWFVGRAQDKKNVEEAVEKYHKKNDEDAEK